MNVAARIGVQSFAAHAVTALEQYLTMLLGVADVLASQDSEVASDELRGALERSIRALHGMHEICLRSLSARTT